ncbi:DUF1793-domain-containing protein [Coniophora puteana RWD-64-598 SS2]|uniref:DUF1793-domain-containing protein n=1 Tax=Coniophora puteana (strain RWD-64-598) TaxID=741705 RepID=A0A5M3N0B4_CONPW|nr:DUF1793-domain-containing protein [Coniophora puteana RWD-64-598 SS2]EIW84808.1 DUF1793-domain-containing protein [Coniophora puteana RWD-64-598 SS2]
MESAAISLRPPSVPLAVRSPYLSAWLPQGPGAMLAGTWPRFWNGSILGWAGYIRVDDTTYTFLGDPSLNPGLAIQKSVTYTSTQSTFVLTAGPVDITVRFLSPVEPDDLVKQSIPFSYMAVSVAANDGGSHSVRLYTDICAEWASGDNTHVVTWTSSTSGDVWSHRVGPRDQVLYSEQNDQAEYGSAYYATQNSNNATGKQFINNGELANHGDTNFRAVSGHWPVFAFAHDLGIISGASDPVIYAIGHIRDPAVQYVTAAKNLQDRNAYYWTMYSSVSDLIDDFVKSYSTALSDANVFDNKVKSDATTVSDQYYDIVALSVRQNINTVDVIMPAWPVFLYTSPTLCKYLLLGLFEYQQSGLYPNRWAAHDLGASYPSAIGHNDGNDLPMPLEECGNMIIMVLSYTQRSNGQSFALAYIQLLEQWTDCLVQGALVPADQYSSDSATANHHLALTYGDLESWGLMYNLYADKLLGTNVFPQSLFASQTAWYRNVINEYGAPLDSRSTYTKSDWLMWTAAFVTENAVRDAMINAVHPYISDGQNDMPFGDWYDTHSGDSIDFRGRPVVGGHLALLVL